MCAMSDGSESPTGVSRDGDDAGVLSHLPRTRPQRASPRRAAARRQAARKAQPTAEAPSLTKASSSAKAQPRAERDVQPATSAADNGAGHAAGRGGPRRSASAEPARKRPSGARPGKRSVASGRRAPALEEVPSQGYETDDEATGPVRPPGGAELLVSAAEIVGELAKAGISGSERVLKGVLSRLPLS
jgi:hypothetical protein